MMIGCSANSQIADKVLGEPPEKLALEYRNNVWSRQQSINSIDKDEIETVCRLFIRTAFIA